MVILEKSGCIWAKVVVFRQKWLYSGKRCRIRGKVVIFLQSGCIGKKFSLFWQSGFSRAKVVVIGKK